MKMRKIAYYSFGSIKHTSTVLVVFLPDIFSAKYFLTYCNVLYYIFHSIHSLKYMLKSFSFVIVVVLLSTRDNICMFSQAIETIVRNIHFRIFFIPISAICIILQLPLCHSNSLIFEY